MIGFFAAGEPKTAGSKKAFVNPKTGRVIVTDDVGAPGRAWRSDVREAAMAAMGGLPPLEGALGMTTHFFVPRPKGHYGSGRNAGQLKASAPVAPATLPDLTKMLRAVEDAIKGICFRDDAQIVSQWACKFYASEGRVGVSVSIAPISESNFYAEPERPQLVLVDGGKAE